MTLPGPNKRACTVYLLRHGDSSPDSVRRFIGRSDHPLNATGLAQAEWWRRELAHIPFGHICCSDLQRSVETARIIGQQIGTPLTILPDLREIDLGSWDGMPVREVRRLFPREFERRGADLAGYRPPGGESFADLAARAVPAFETIVHTAEEHLLIVGHAGVNRMILCHLLGMPQANLFQLGQEYGCLNIIRSMAGLWVVERVNIPAKIISSFHTCHKTAFPL